MRCLFTDLHGFFNLSHPNSHILKLKNKEHRNNTISSTLLQAWLSLRLKHAHQTGSSPLMNRHVSITPFSVIWLFQIESLLQSKSHIRQKKAYAFFHLIFYRCKQSVSHTVKTPSCVLLDTRVSEMPFYISAWFLQPQSP